MLAESDHGFIGGRTQKEFDCLLRFELILQSHRPHLKILSFQILVQLVIYLRLLWIHGHFVVGAADPMSQVPWLLQSLDLSIFAEKFFAMRADILQDQEVHSCIVFLDLFALFLGQVISHVQKYGLKTQARIECRRATVLLQLHGALPRRPGLLSLNLADEVNLLSLELLS